MRGALRAILRSFDHPLPWLMASVAVGGLVAGLAPTGVIATERDLDNALRTQELSREALGDIGVRLPALHSELANALGGSRPVATKELPARLAALDAAWGQYLRMPASDREEAAADEAWTEYREWRWEVALPAIDAVERREAPAGEAVLASIPMPGDAVREVQELSALNQKQSNSEVAAAWREYRLRTAILVGTSIAGIVVALAAAMTGVSRMRPPREERRKGRAEAVALVRLEDPAGLPQE